jgi:L-2-hydroxyglutarate oxidase
LLIDKNGDFASESLLMEGDSSLHILNYNSPGATGALPVAADIVRKLIERGIMDGTSRQNISPFTDEF